MQELVLFGQVPESSHHLLLQQLAGISRMQPLPHTERHLIFRAQPPTALDRVQQGGGSQGVLPPEVQRTRAMLQGPLFHVQLVQEVSPSDSTSTPKTVNGTSDSSKNWTLEFRDIPDPSSQTVTSRLLSRTTIDSGSPFPFLHSLGFDYTSQYLLSGHRFFSDDITISLHRIYPIPSPAEPSSPPPPISDLKPLDPSQAYVLQASIELQLDSQNTPGNQELRARATQELVGLRDMLNESVVLAPGERLSLDTRVNMRALAAAAR